MQNIQNPKLKKKLQGKQTIKIYKKINHAICIKKYIIKSGQPASTHAFGEGGIVVLVSPTKTSE